jgi:hypothetical protein
MPTPALIKPKACRHCKTSFTPVKQMQVVCSPMCGLERARIKREAKEKAEAKIKNRLEREQFKARKEKAKTWSEHHADTQKAVNAKIRARDAGKPCISCNAPWSPTFQAGHYRSRGAAKNLALDERNIHGQCVQCNLHRHGNGIDFRIGLIGRYGVLFVEAIEADNQPRHHSIDDLKAIRAAAMAETKQLKEKAQ